MQRRCAYCERPFEPKDLAKEESKGMEADRKRLGLEGVLFRYYSCPACGHGAIFVDVRPLEGELPEDFRERRRQLEAVVTELHAERVKVVVQEK
jgi:DNA-directed RNA polymerase subunit RPC12/RpoP